MTFWARYQRVKVQHILYDLACLSFRYKLLARRNIFVEVVELAPLIKTIFPIPFNNLKPFE